MFRKPKEETLNRLREALEAGEELKEFSIFEIEEAKVAADEWYRGLLFTLRDALLSPDAVIQDMNGVLEKEDKQLYTPAIRFVVPVLTEQMEKAQKNLLQKIEEILTILKNYMDVLSQC